MEIDAAKNRHHVTDAALISRHTSRIAIAAIETDEELQMVYESMDLLSECHRK
jgi:acetate kinase